MLIEVCTHREQIGRNYTPPIFNEMSHNYHWSLRLV